MATSSRLWEFKLEKLKRKVLLDIYYKLSKIAKSTVQGQEQKTK